MTDKPNPDQSHQLDPTSVAVHYKELADFFEARVKVRLDQLLKAEQRVRELEAELESVTCRLEDSEAELSDLAAAQGEKDAD